MIASVPIVKIRVDERSRALDEEAMVSLIESINVIGLRTPISVQIDPSSHDECYLLVAGLHRLEACRRLGMAYIDARIIDLDETERRLWEISENLHRAELTALERSEHIAELARLAEERRCFQSAQVDPIESKREDGRGHRHESGINAAARELNIGRTEAQRATRIAGLTPAAKAEARALGLDDNQSTLLKAAKVPSKEAQIRALREEAARKAAGRDPAGASEARLETAMGAVRRLSQNELAAFAEWFNAFRLEHAEGTSGNTALPQWTMRP
jgi:ParB-like chromosome segregation protein Spo0J